MTTDDRDLRERFAALRREEEEAADFGRVWSRAGEASGFRRRGLAPAAAVLILVVGALLWLREGPRLPRGQAGPLPSITDWKAPTDFLLETPGREVLRTVPMVGGDGWWPISGKENPS